MHRPHPTTHATPHVTTPRGDDPVVVTEGLTRRFGSTVAVDDVSITVRGGEVFGLLGHNGAGKTTLLRLVTGLLRPDAGHVTTLGDDPSESAVAIRRHTGVVTESTALDGFLTVRENLVAHARLYKVDRDRIAGNVAGVLTHFGLGDVADRRVRGLSAGMRQRAAFARALVHEPRLLLLDEPTANLDPVAAYGVRTTLTGLVRQRGVTILLATHNLAEAQAVCDRVAIIQQGRVRVVGTLGELAGTTPTTMVRTRPDHAEDAIAVLAGFGHASTDGDPSRLVVAHDAPHDAPVDVATMVSALVAADVPVLEVTSVEPTLENVYLDLHRSREQS